ncbi:diaminopropionate ammonia-lyase [Pseudomonas sp. DWRC2-2]|uniref:diaminopropionate ammonia-lyase n=1 Tax=Pseudomonas sp. DWRC2-2 TaxID=2804567 RepID=UPI003CE945E9
MLFSNPNAKREAYPQSLQKIMSIKQANESRNWLSKWNQLSATATPLWDLRDLAKQLNVEKICVKDESYRSPLGSFKALGAPIALVRLILQLFPEKNFNAQALLAGDYQGQLGSFTAISATDGNHGRALAAAAQSVGCRCVIVLHANVSVEREEAIAAYGAEIVRIAGNYDESVERAATLARENQWYVVSDTSYEGYEIIPRDVMQGYGTIAAEIIEVSEASQREGRPFTHIFLQGGVGGMAAGLASYFWELYGVDRPTLVVVEPSQADCLYQSALNGQASNATGSVDSVMAGLACGETSPLAWKFLGESVDHFMLISDDDAVAAMRVLAAGSGNDVPVVGGESGVAGLAGLINLAGAPADAARVGLNKGSRVLIINTEGATAPSVYEELVGESGESVQKRQQSWLSIHKH